MKTNADQQLESAPTHRSYWADSRNRPWCCDCYPPPDGVAVFHVGSSVNDEIYEWEERLAIKQEG